MPHHTGNFIVPLVALLLASLAISPARADEEFDAALQASRLPWYDSEANSLKSSLAPERPDSAVADRDRIPPAIVKKKGQQVTQPAAAPTAPVTPPSSISSVATMVIYTVAGVLLAALIGLLIYSFLKLESDDGGETGKDTRRKRKIRDHIKHLPFEIEEQDGDFESFAEKALRGGDYSKAVIYLFADLLVAMSEAGVVRLQRGKTNRQYLNEIHDHGEIRPYYQRVMTAFEDAFFGKHEIEQRRAAECFSQRPRFDTALEKIRQAKFAEAQHSPLAPSAKVRIEGAS